MTQQDVKIRQIELELEAEKAQNEAKDQAIVELAALVDMQQEGQLTDALSKMGPSAENEDVNEVQSSDEEARLQ